jgi:hypothetical protein
MTDKISGKKVTVTLNLQATDDITTRYGYDDQVNLTFDAVVLERDGGNNVVEEFSRQLRHALATMQRKEETVEALETATREAAEVVPEYVPPARDPASHPSDD